MKLFDAITEYVEAKIEYDTARFGISRESVKHGRLLRSEYNLKQAIERLENPPKSNLSKIVE